MKILDLLSSDTAWWSQPSCYISVQQSGGSTSCMYTCCLYYCINWPNKSDYSQPCLSLGLPGICQSSALFPYSKGDLWSSTCTVNLPDRLEAGVKKDRVYSPEDWKLCWGRVQQFIYTDNLDKSLVNSEEYRNLVFLILTIILIIISFFWNDKIKFWCCHYDCWWKNTILERT